VKKNAHEFNISSVYVTTTPHPKAATHPDHVQQHP